jgi:23S rRNA-/tRNA-specific pseudouridylate synthase
MPRTLAQSQANDDTANGSSRSSDITASSSSSARNNKEQDAATSTTPAAAAATPMIVRRTSRTYCVTGVTRRGGALNEAVVQILKQSQGANISISLQDATELIAIGAVWARMQSLNEQDLLSLYGGDSNDDSDDYASSTSTSSSRALYADVQVRMQEDSSIDSRRSTGSSKKAKGEGEEDEDEDDLDEYVSRLQNQRFRRILSPSMMEAGTDVRIYPFPRRFTSSCRAMSRENGSLLYEDTTFIVVDKPPMLPTQADSSNYIECCPGCTMDHLGPFQDITGKTLTTRPLLCHRVDACVGGCVVMSKNRNGQAVFHALQRQRKIRKLYLAVTTRPVPLGMHLHWMWSPQTARGKSGGPPCQLVSCTPPESRRKAREFWNRCLLEVVKCEPIVISKGNLEEHNGHAAAAGHSTYDPPAGVQHYQSTIRLVTGRKHQVRAQLASLGCPIIRDTLYQPLSGLTLDRLSSSSADPGGTASGEDEIDLAVAKCRVPTEPIGLQAHAILFGGIRARAKTPWWGSNPIMEPALTSSMTNSSINEEAS